jgi:hypothetical protein
MVSTGRSGLEGTWLEATFDRVPGDYEKAQGIQDMVALFTLAGAPIVSKKQLKDIETQAMIDKWQEELARHVAYLPILCEQAGVDEQELHRAIEIHFYVRSMSKGAMQ